MARRILLPLLLFLTTASAEDSFEWIRYPAIAPDGKTICFSYRGDLWLVPVAGGVAGGAAGGEATPFTTHLGYERSPVWSRDSKRIAFCSDRHGNFDVFIKDVAGGIARRLTHHSGSDVPSDFSPDGKEVLFASARAGDAKANPGAPVSWELYSMAVEGGRPRLVLPTLAFNARWSDDGRRIAYESRPGRENAWRKHHTSSVTRDIWIFDSAAGKHTQWTTSKHEDRNPVWVGEELAFLSARNGVFNVVQGREGSVQARTKLTRHPVRFLSRARDGTLCFTHHGLLYLLPAGGGEPKRVAVHGRVSDRRNGAGVKTLRKGATQFALSPDEKEVAFIVRGELFVASVEHGTTRRLTRTPTQERSPSFAPDGKTIYYAGERDGSWNIYRVSLGRAEDKYFFRSTLLNEEPVLVSADESFQPSVSPDGKRLAFLHNRDEIRVLDLASGNAWTLVPAERNYSYSDGDITYQWSPDSKWLAFNMLIKGNWIENIGVSRADDGKVIDMTRSGYHEGRPRWAPDSSALLFISHRLGRRSHGSWGADGDVFAMDLTQAAHDRARLSEEEFDLRKKKKDKKEKKKDDGDAKEKKEPPKPVTIAFDGRADRTRRLTLHSAPLAAYALSPDGESLVSIARVGDKNGVWLTKWRKGETKRLMKLKERGGDVRFAKDGKSVFVRTGGGRLVRLELKGEPKPIAYGAEMVIDGAAERAYIFDHAWRQVQRKFYEPKLHGADWEGLRKEYQPKLAEIENNHDFAELLSELLGELNASHTGCYYRPKAEAGDRTAALGLFFDPRDRGDGLLVMEVLKGGPAAKADSGITAGARLVRIDGVTLNATVNTSALLNRRAGKRVLLTFVPKGGTVEKQAVVEPIALGAARQLLYRRWVRNRRDLTDKLSKGRIGYVHVRGMGDRSFRHLYQEALGRFSTREALIVDTRNNGGGWLHDDLVKFFEARPYLKFHPRGKRAGELGGEPFNRWAKPSAVLINERNYSDAHIFPYAFQKLGIGPLIGAPVAGTGTAVWWETQIDGTLNFGIPQVGMLELGGGYIENLDLKPDVLVLHDPESAANGDDPQLEKAVETLLVQLK